MTLREATERYREKATGMVGLERDPRDRSTDNGLLFSATWLLLMARQQGEGVDVDDIRWFEELVGKCERVPGSGLLARYPGEEALTTHDDLTGVVVAAHLLGMPSTARRIYCCLAMTDYNYAGNWVGRIIDFPPLLKVCARVPLSLGSQISFAAAFLWNVWGPHRNEDGRQTWKWSFGEPREETSGRCLLYLKSLAVQGKYGLVDVALGIWRWRMRRLYTLGMKDVYTIYFGTGHPFSLFAPTDFGEGAKLR